MSTITAFDAIITKIGEEARPKSNGKFYQLCEVRFTSGKLSGKTYFAQRTLGENKSAVTVGQNIRAILQIVKGEDGKDRPFFEISTSTVDSSDDILSALA